MLPNLKLKKLHLPDFSLTTVSVNFIFEPFWYLRILFMGRGGKDNLHDSYFFAIGHTCKSDNNNSRKVV